MENRTVPFFVPFFRSRFIDACNGLPTDCTPVWLMRQAGRYQPSYRKLREKVSFFELCRTPDLAAQVTVTAAEELGTDAAIIFSDILVPLIPMGVPVKIDNKGPQIEAPVRSRTDIDKLKQIDSATELSFVGEAIHKTVAALGEKTPVIGFAGGPFTLASYLLEGGHSRNFTTTKRLLFEAPHDAHALLEKLAVVVANHLRAQAQAGCRAVQVFDTWSGVLSPVDYETFCLPYLKRIFADLADLDIPRIVFATNTGTLTELIKQSGADVIGVDWRIDIGEARKRLGPNTPVQGNLDPCCLFMDEADLQERVQQIIASAGRQGHVFNLGHGVLPETDPQKARLLVDLVHDLSQNETVTGGSAPNR